MSDVWQPPYQLDERDVVDVTGKDAATYLQSQLSQDIRGLADGDQAWTFILEPTGKVDALARITRVDGEHFRMDTDPGFGESLAARLRQFMIRVAVELQVTAASRQPSSASEAQRIEAGWPRMGNEITAGTTIPAETGLTKLAVSFTKG
ncbi:MAG TPA: hypothetical protein PKV27_13125, partial [Ilumatobacteraceae bacterium]|nr:hypothetical protein [Ilumatobacteraceae bacterium]